MYMGQFSSLKVLHENMTSSFHFNPTPINKQTLSVIYIALNANYLQQLKKKDWLLNLKIRETSTQGANMEKL